MKFNKWTLGLAAVGAVSMASAVRADEAKMSVVNTALSSTTLSGYVDVGAVYIPGNQNGAFIPTGVPTIDGFVMNDVDIALDKPLDATAWSAGYHVEFNAGAQAVGIAGFRQAYITMNTPLGNGIQWKVGVQDDIIGYEGNTDGANPNYTRSYGYAVEPTSMLGLTGTYQFCSAVSFTAGIINAQSGPGTLSSKDYVAALNLTAPDSWGFLKGGTATLGIFHNYDKNGVQNYYAGVTIPTPLSKVKVGAAFDLVSQSDKTIPTGGNPNNDSGWVAGVYTTIAATDKLSFNLRAEYFSLNDFLGYANLTAPFGGNLGVGEEVTATVQYNIWANVTSRAEFRWDHVEHNTSFGDFAGVTSATPYSNDYTLALDLIYTF